MWDIKPAREGLSRLAFWGFYLNHVGYKVVARAALGSLSVLFYLNHVGYKELEIPPPCRRRHKFYLNHVGYKVRSPGGGLMEDRWFYLNHVGYKGNCFFYPKSRSLSS